MHDCLEVDSVMMSYSNRQILSDIYLRCHVGDIIGLLGLNGEGKSTLLKIIFGTLKAENSFIRINGEIMKWPSYLSGLVAYLPQHHFLILNYTVEELMLFYIPEKDREIFLKDPFLSGLKKEKVKNLSVGEQRYLEIKLILYCNSPYILLDEPFNGLYPLAIQSIQEHIKIVSETKGIILTDHNYREVYKVANRMMLLEKCYLKEIYDIKDLRPYVG